MYSLPSVQNLARSLAQVNGIGHKTAERFALEIATLPAERRQRLIVALEAMEQTLGVCAECNALSESSPCPICLSASRNRQQLCVVETFHDLVAIENAGVHFGLYHVLGGNLSPVAQRTAGDLFLQSLASRVQQLGAGEVILAMPHIPESRITLELVKNIIAAAKTNSQVTFFASELPIGTPLSLCAVESLKNAFQYRKNAVDEQEAGM